MSSPQASQTGLFHVVVIHPSGPRGRRRASPPSQLQDSSRRGRDARLPPASPRPPPLRAHAQNRGVACIAVPAARRGTRRASSATTPVWHFGEPTSNVRAILKHYSGTTRESNTSGLFVHERISDEPRTATPVLVLEPLPLA